METERPFVLPGDSIDPSLIPVPRQQDAQTQNSKKQAVLRLGPGLRHMAATGAIVPTVPGQLVVDGRKRSMWVESKGGRYVASVGDVVIGQVQRSAGGDLFYVNLSPYTSNAILPHLAFEGASKKTRPQLAPGALVYARVSLANRHMDPELECVSPATGKADGLGPLVGGTVFDVSLGLARRLLMARSREEGQVAVLDFLGDEGLAFETAIGRNGKVWVRSDSIKTMIAVGRALQKTDEDDLSVDDQRKMVKWLIKSMR
ncbi:hypothetical protein QBC46DRAFT_378151 [Diplogelasinospora grovesii]|uniref:Ribosomal RNA-processing protein 40 n=1 Tax=Diplogelasinospora grovesii TaxID=303347 RepID=A0AAN6NF80_9PEZI|nr:hypothetical protein QBC46DRAFT_378151 [Diplogelasinospora grovesii]